MSNLLETVPQGTGTNDSRNKWHILNVARSMQTPKPRWTEGISLRYGYSAVKFFAWSHSYHFQRSSVISSVCFLFSVMIFNLKLIHFNWNQTLMRTLLIGGENAGCFVTEKENFHKEIHKISVKLFFLLLLPCIHYANRRFVNWWQELARCSRKIQTTNALQLQGQYLQKGRTRLLVRYTSRGIFSDRCARGEPRAKPRTTIKSPDWWNKG